MSIYNYLAKNIILPVSDFLLNKEITKYIEILNESQYWDPSEMRVFQDERLRSLVKHAYENVPYYNELFKKLKITPGDIRNQEDLYKIPVITKKEMKDNGKRMWAVNAKDYFTNSSSGSTGEPFKYLIDKTCDSISKASDLRGMSWQGYKLGDKYIKISVNPRTGLVKNLQDRMNRSKYLYSNNITNTNAKKILYDISKYKPKMIRSYPSTLSILGEYAIKMGYEFNSIKLIYSSGEILFPHLKRIIEEAFSAPVYDSYSGEGGAIFSECSDHTHYHISEEYAITELLKDDEVFSEGTGEIISTNLWNYAMPFIRYNVKDIATISSIPCNKGIKLKTVEKIFGRDVDIITTVSGKKLIVHFFTGYFEWINEVDRFECVQIAEDEILLKLVVNERFNEKIKNKITYDVKEYIGHDMKLSILIVDDIPVNPVNGKRRFLYKDF